MRSKFLKMLGGLFHFATLRGIDMVCFTFYRSTEDQLKEFDAGRSRTKTGKHPLWLAVDLALWDDIDIDQNIDKDEVRWSNDPRYVLLGEFWESIGGTWGGRWGDPNDPYHFEL